MKKVILIIILIIAGVVVLVSLRSDSGGNLADTTPKPKTFDKAPDFSLKDYEGNTVSLADFSGEPVVLNSWAVWCPFCVDELPDFAAVQKEFKDQVTIISIDRAESLQTAKEFTDELGITNDLIFLLDPRDSFYRSIGGFSMPETLFVDREGNIIEHKRGPMTQDEIRQKVQNLISS